MPDWIANGGIRDQPLCISRMRELLKHQPKVIGVAVARIQTMKLHMLTDNTVFEEQVLRKKRARAAATRKLDREQTLTMTPANQNSDSKHSIHSPTPTIATKSDAFSPNSDDSDDEKLAQMNSDGTLRPATDAQLARVFRALPGGGSKYDQLLDDCFAEAEAAIRTDGWHYEGKSSGVDCYTKAMNDRPAHSVGTSTQSVVCCKGIGVIAAPADVVVWCWGSVQKLRPQWDEMFSHGTQIESVDAATSTSPINHAIHPSISCAHSYGD
jgi:hypothetical protein